MENRHSDEQVSIRVIGGPTVVIGYAGLTFLTDPTFDAPQSYPGDFTKTAGPAATPEDLGVIDAVLLSHDEHIDNLDLTGRQLLDTVPVTLTTTSGAQRLGGSAKGLAPWQSDTFVATSGDLVTVTAMPALHGPDGAESVVGQVIGFLLTSDRLPSIYISGDNASLDAVAEIAHRHGSVDTAVLFAGAVRRPVLDGALLTFDGEGAAQAALLLGARRVIPAHVDGWAHFTEGRNELAAAFEAAGISHLL